MSAHLTLRCVLALLLAMTLALASGLLAWGPIGPGSHHYADTRALAGIAGAANALASLPLVLVAFGGVAALRRSRWPAEVVRPWQLFFAAAGSASLLAALYHLQPDDGSHLLAQLLMAAAFTLLLAGFLAERVHPQFGSRSACVIALLLPLLAALWSLLAEVWIGVADRRGLLLLQLLPVLLVPAGALALAGRVTSAGDWLAMLLLYALAKLLEAADAPVYAALGWISGHSLMHLVLAGVALWLAYRALAESSRAAGAGSAAASSSRCISSASTSA